MSLEIVSPGQCRLILNMESLFVLNIKNILYKTALFEK